MNGDLKNRELTMDAVRSVLGDQGVAEMQRFLVPRYFDIWNPGDRLLISKITEEVDDMFRNHQNLNTSSESIQESSEIINIEELVEQRDDLERSFDLRRKADMRAIKRWQEQGPGRELTWPDHADMVVWLLGELDQVYSWLVDYHRRCQNFKETDPLLNKARAFLKATPEEEE